jgi:hypothetical protein
MIQTDQETPLPYYRHSHLLLYLIPSIHHPLIHPSGPIHPHYTILYIIQDGILLDILSSINYFYSHSSRALPTLHRSAFIDHCFSDKADRQDKERVSMLDDSLLRLHLMPGLYLVLDSVLV